MTRVAAILRFILREPVTIDSRGVNLSIAFSKPL